MVAQDPEKVTSSPCANLAVEPAIQRPLWQRRRGWGVPVGVNDPAKVPTARRRRVWVMRDVTHFEQLEQVGEGTYGQVWSARDKKTNEIVALKRIRMDNEREGFPLTAIREIKLLKTLNHENVVNLKEIVTDPKEPGPASEASSSSQQKLQNQAQSANGTTNSGRKGDLGVARRGVSKRRSQQQHQSARRPKAESIYMVFEFMDYDLVKIMDTKKITFSVPQVKNMAKQILKGLAYCHEREVLHRDLKGSNVLIDKRGNLKLADFGLARKFGESGRKYTNRVVTLWYRSPELLLGATQYGVGVDMWSAGCLIAELLTGRPLFSGRDEPEQMNRIWKICGSPNDDIWPAWKELPHSSMVRSGDYSNRLPSVFTHVDDLTDRGLDLIQSLLSLDPDKRPTAEEALEHSWFQEEPLACPNSSLNWEDIMNACEDGSPSSQEKGSTR